ncbi:MAG: hypothetical protein KDC24_12745 [Saprospiraceae bacterium]|nr:hypothetical protein [Saprospiraceae bacterium]
MKRRSFIQFNSVLGFGLVSGLPEVFYNSPMNSWKLTGFDKEVSDYLHEIATQIISNVENPTLGKKIATDLLSPIEIIEQENLPTFKKVIFKNVEGSFVQFTFQNGKNKISMLKDLPSKSR